MSRSSLHVSVDPPADASLDDLSTRGFSTVRDVLQQGLVSHMESGSEWFRSADVQIVVDQCQFDAHYSMVQVSVGGDINGEPLAAEVFQAEISAPLGRDTVALATGGLAGLALSDAVDSALERLRSDQPVPHPNALDQQLLFQILEFIDRAAGRAASPAAQLWDRVRRVRWIAAAAALVGVAVLGLTRGGLTSNGLLGGLMFGALSAPLAFLLAHLIGLLRMPDEFFTTETAGKKVLVMTGVGSVGGLRGVAVVASIFLVACFAGVLYMVWGIAGWN